MSTNDRKRRATRKPVAKPKAAVPLTNGSRRAKNRGSFYIVGIGASAGGLEALDHFFGHVPDKCGLAFVVVQHLDPTHKGMMVELLQRATLLKVRQVKDRLKIEPDNIYVIPPNKDISILNGVLHLFAPVEPRGLRLPIDFFFRSLAADQQARAIGVILSGMGSDGTLGLRAIKEQAGAVFVQAPESAKFDAMPRSAIDAGLADVTAPVEELPGRILGYLRHVPLAARSSLPLSTKTQSAIEKVCALLRAQTGHDFSQYKRSTVHRRIERRMGLQQLSRGADYLRYLRESPHEAQLLFKELLIGVTSFFRDPAAWEHMEKVAIPALLSERDAGAVLRAWVAGCSTGEEAYSLAIVFKEVLAQIRPPKIMSLQVFATDLDKDAITRARQGFYPSNIASDVSAQRLQRFFIQEEDGYRVSPEIREMVIFAVQNVVSDPPFTKLDIITCRNLLIYLAPELQKKLLPIFHYGLNRGGILFLGSAETVGVAPDSFSLTDPKTRIYRRGASPARSETVEFPSAFPTRPHTASARTPAKAEAPTLQTLTEKVLLHGYVPAAVLTNEQGDILYISGRTGKYLEPAAGRANWNIHAMAREGVRYRLAAAFRKALREKRRVDTFGMKLGSGSGDPQRLVDLTVEPLYEPELLRGTVITVFANATFRAGAKASAQARQPGLRVEIEHALRQAREDLRTTRLEMQASQEELKSANEEMQSTNEELQSTNEELTTSKEEMQSLNEELQTLNHELTAKVDELSRTNDDMRNLLDSTDIATLFLDDSLRIRRFTTQMTKIVKVIQSDLNRPITDLASDLIYPELASDARSVLETLVLTERPVATRDGRWFSVRIMPYRTVTNRIRGVVITFVDITASKTLEATLRKKQLGYEA